ncbi:MAG: adenylate/guanylate cyclase domain-containing protein, partial [Nitrososphaeraceae archaeon]
MIIKIEFQLPDQVTHIDQDQNLENWKKGMEKKGPKSTANMIMAEGERSKKPMAVTIDTEALVTQPQERLSRALKRRYQYESNLKPAQEFLINHINSKIPLAIMYADLAGSTKMSMTLPVNKMVTTIRAFLYEMSYIVQSHEGYVLKYVGDAVIGFFPSI